MATQKTLNDLAEAQAYVARLEAQKTAEDGAEAAMAAASSSTPVTVKVKVLGIQIHALMCPGPHDDSIGACSWKATPFPDDSTKCDWTEPAHVLWLTRARSGIKAMKTIGFTVTE